MTSTTMPTSMFARTIFTKIWDRLTDPSSLIVEREQKRRARLLAAMLTFLIPLGIFGTVILPLLTIPNWNPITDAFFPPVIVGEILMMVAYALSRTRFHTFGATLLILTISGTILLGARVVQDPLSLIVYLGLNTLLASLLTNLRQTILIGIISTASVVLFPLLQPATTLSATSQTNSVAFILIMSILTTAAANLRNRDLEQIESQSNQLAAALERAESANAAKRDFLATMSHELRTPLNAIIGFTEVMMMGLTGELPTQAERTTQRIHHNSERLLGLIDDILDISKIEAGRIDVVAEPFEPTRLVSSVQTGLAPQAKAKGLDFIVDIDKGLPTQITGDFARIEQVVLNLGSNAIKFTSKGSVNIALKPLDETQWTIIVTDTGIGIPSHALSFIFEKFRQVDGSTRRAFGGSGLGLAISKELVLLMNGNIKVESQLEVGSKFTVTLPLQRSNNTH